MKKKINKNGVICSEKSADENRARRRVCVCVYVCVEYSDGVIRRRM